jgi:hypothetical protein
MASASVVLGQLSALIDNVLPGSKRRAPMIIGSNGGFAIAVPGGGQVLVSAGYDDPWFLTVTVGLAYNVENISGALAWVNSRNSDFSFGRFYVSLPGAGDPRANVVFQDRVISLPVDCAPNVVKDWLPQVIKLGTEIAANEPNGCIGAVGGQPFADTDEDRLILLAGSLV